MRPELTGMGAVPHSAAKEAEVRSRSGLSPAVMSIWAPMTAPTPLIATRACIVSAKRRSLICSGRAVAQVSRGVDQQGADLFKARNGSIDACLGSVVASPDSTERAAR